VNFILRDARPEDFEILWRIDQRCFAPGIAYSRRELSAYMRRRGSFTVVADASGSSGTFGAQTRPVNAEFGGILGFIVAESGSRGIGHIISIDVLPEDRRLGIGSRLLDAIEERFRTGLCRRARLETAVDNAAALAFYKRHHYSIVKVLARYYPNGVDAFLMDKSLSIIEMAGTPS
jgi:[ribosomal protein S18]-alanine N-acetyltransferase